MSAAKLESQGEQPDSTPSQASVLISKIQVDLAELTAHLNLGGEVRALQLAPATFPPDVLLFDNIISCVNSLAFLLLPGLQTAPASWDKNPRSDTFTIV